MACKERTHKPMPAEGQNLTRQKRESDIFTPVHLNTVHFIMAHSQKVIDTSSENVPYPVQCFGTTPPFLMRNDGEQPGDLHRFNIISKQNSISFKYNTKLKLNA